MEPRPVQTDAAGYPLPVKPTPEQLRQAQTDVTHFHRTLPAMVQSMMDDLYSTYGEKPSADPDDPRPTGLEVVWSSDLPDLIREEAKKYIEQRDRVYSLAFNRANRHLYERDAFAPTEAADETDDDEDKPF